MKFLEDTTVKKIKFLSLLLVFVNVLIFTPTAVVSADDNFIETNNITVVSEQPISNNYHTYIKAYESYEYGRETLKIHVGRNMDESNKTVTAVFDVKSAGLYNLGFRYSPSDNSIVNITANLRIDGYNPFVETKRISLPRFWKDGGRKEDAVGNEYVSEPVAYENTSNCILFDNGGLESEPYLFYFSAGEHSICIDYVDGSFLLEDIELIAPEKIGKYSAPKSNKDFYSGSPIIIQGEDALLKNSFWLSSASDSSSVNVSPNSKYKSLINYIGGSNWSSAGDTIIWETPELEAGYYNIAFSYKQENNVGSSVYRWLKVDGKTPFTEAKGVTFDYAYDWEKVYFSDGNDVPYLIYLSEGKHEISLTADLGEIYKVIEILTDTVDKMSSLYVDITMITGQTVDIYRDYDLFDQLPNMETDLRTIMKGLNKCVKLLSGGDTNSTSSQISVIDNMRLVVSQLLDDKLNAQKYISTYYSNYCSVAATLSDLRKMPLSLDSIILSSPNENVLKSEHNFFDKISFSIVKFLMSFTDDYAKANINNESLEVWVNWGRDQAQILNSLIESYFTPKNNTAVNVRVTNASMVQAVLSGNGPDMFLHASRSEPVNLAMRGVLYNLDEFNDVDEVLKRFNADADTPYRYKGDLYALPDTQNFYLMYYRTDIFDELGLQVPKTWEEFAETSKKLSKKNLYTWIPFVQVTDPTQTNTGVASLSLFPTLMLQNGLSMYKDDYHSSSLTDESTIRVFTDWTNYYTKMKFSISMDFYNRFRTGVCPLGISTLATYTTLEAAASEIEGKWAVTAIPGTVRSDGSVSHVSAGSGTACGILKSSKNPEKAWDFLKWWTEADTQLSYSNNVESVLGPSARVTVSNIEAFKKMSWNIDMKENIYFALEQIEEIPEVPGSYYLSRAIDHSFWNVANANKKPKNMLLKWGKEVDDEIARKWKQYDNR